MKAGTRSPPSCASGKPKCNGVGPGVAVRAVEHDEHPTVVGGRQEIRALVELGDLDPSDVEVQLWHGLTDLDEELKEPAMLPMTVLHDGPSGWVYSASLDCSQLGMYGFAARVVSRAPRPVFLARDAPRAVVANTSCNRNVRRQALALSPRRERYSQHHAQRVGQRDERVIKGKAIGLRCTQLIAHLHNRILCGPDRIGGFLG
jgi:hypothetical protein